MTENQRVVKIERDENLYYRANVSVGGKPIFSHVIYEMGMITYVDKESGEIQHVVLLKLAEDEIEVNADYVIYPDGLLEISEVVEDELIVKTEYKWRYD